MATTLESLEKSLESLEIALANYSIVTSKLADAQTPAAQSADDIIGRGIGSVIIAEITPSVAPTPLTPDDADALVAQLNRANADLRAAIKAILATALTIAAAA